MRLGWLSPLWTIEGQVVEGWHVRLQTWTPKRETVTVTISGGLFAFCVLTPSEPPLIMFSSPSTTSTGVQRRSVASSALRSAGLSSRTEEDVRMQDASGGAKRSTRQKLHDRPTRSKRLERLEEAASSAANKSSVIVSCSFLK